MPSIIVTPDYANESSFAGPVINGVTFRRPTALTRTREPVRNTVELANGATRQYVKGSRWVFTIAWARLVRAEVDALEYALSPAVVTFNVEQGDWTPYTVDTDAGFTVDALPGTYPVRYACSVTLREQTPS